MSGEGLGLAVQARAIARDALGFRMHRQVTIACGLDSLTDGAGDSPTSYRQFLKPLLTAKFGDPVTPGWVAADNGPISSIFGGAFGKSNLSYVSDLPWSSPIRQRSFMGYGLSHAAGDGDGEWGCYVEEAAVPGLRSAAIALRVMVLLRSADASFRWRSSNPESPDAGTIVSAASGSPLDTVLVLTRPCIAGTQSAVQIDQVMAPLLAKMHVAALSMGKEIDEEQERYFLRFIEQAGGLANPKRAAELTDGLFRALQSSGGNVQAGDYQSFLARAGIAGSHLSNRSMFADFEPLIAELHEQAGVGLATGFKMATGIKVNSRAAAEFMRLAERRAGEADEVSIELDDSDGLLGIPPRGALMRVAIGWRTGSGVTLGLVDKGSFRVDEAGWSGPPDIVTIRGRSADLTADFARRRDASYRETTLGEIARQVAARQGLQASVAPSLAAIAVPVVGQSATSDMALLRRLGRRYDAVATVKAGRLILAPIGAGVTAAGAAIPAAGVVRRADASRYGYELVARDDSDGVEAAWHDQDAGERKIVRVGGAKRPRRIRRTFATEGEAQRAAEAQRTRQQRAQATFDVELPLGRAELYPDRAIALAGFKPEVDQRRWLIATTEHRVDGAGGFTTSLRLESEA